MKCTFNKPYRFAENGYSFTEYEAGKEYEVSQSCADSARQSGFVDEPEEKAAPEGKPAADGKPASLFDPKEPAAKEAE